MHKIRKVMTVARVAILCLSVVLLAIATLSGMLMNYLLVFLLASAGIMFVTLIVAIVTRDAGRNLVGVEPARTFVMRGILRNAAWIVIGVCVHIALVPIQFSSQESSGLQTMLWGSVAALCVMDWIPRKRIGRSLTITLSVFLVFLSLQLAIIYFPSQSENSVALSAPLDGDWYVMQGGNSALINHHHFAGSQKYALDIIDPDDGTLPLQQVTDLNQYASFGRPLYSPVAGVVVTVEDSLPDQEVGKTDPKHVAGNHIVVETESGVFVLMAHLQENSVLMTVGDEVAVGQAIARIGNSGNTTQPHLHIQAMTGPELSDADSKPVSISFKVNQDETRTLKRNDRGPDLSG